MAASPMSCRPVPDRPPRAGDDEGEVLGHAVVQIAGDAPPLVQDRREHIAGMTASEFVERARDQDRGRGQAQQQSTMNEAPGRIDQGSWA
jgi:hypothetical protein